MEWPVVLFSPGKTASPFVTCQFSQLSSVPEKPFSNILRFLSTLEELNARTENVKEFLQQLIQYLTVHFQAERTAVGLLDPKSKILELHCAYRLGEEQSCCVLDEGCILPHFRQGEGLLYAAVQSNRALVVNNAPEDPRFVPPGEGAASPVSLICMPVVVEDLATFAISIAHEKPAAFAAVPETLLDHLSLVISRMLHAKLEREDLRMAQARLNALGQSLPAHLYAQGEGRRYVYQNPVSCEMHGDAKGKRLEELGLSPRIYKHFKELENRAWNGEVMDDVYEFHFDGRRTIISSYIAPVWLDGKIQGIIGLDRDITEKELVREGLMQTLTNLEQRVKDRTTELAEANRELRLEVDDRAAAEKALRKSEERFRQVLRHANVALYRYDAKADRYDYVSDVVEKLTGITVEDWKRKTMADAIREIHPEDAPRLQAAIAKAATQAEPGTPVNLEIAYRRRFKTDAYQWVFDSIALFFDEEGNLDSILGSAFDITEQKEAEEALRQSQVLSQAMVETIPALIAMFQNGRVYFVNPHFREVLGYDDTDLKKMTVEAFWPEDEKTFMDQKELARLAQEKTPRRFEAPMLAKNGDKYWLDIAMSNITIDKKATTILVASDITKRREAREQNRQSERLLQSVLDSIDEALIVLDKDLTVMRSNRAMDTFFSDRLPLIGKACYEVLHNKKRPCQDCGVLDCFKQGVPVSQERPHTLQSGEEACIRMHLYPIKDHTGKVSLVVQHARDITEEKKRETRRQEEWDKACLMAKLAYLLACEQDMPIWPFLRALGEALQTDRAAISIFEKDYKALITSQVWYANDTITRTRPGTRFEAGNWFWSLRELKEKGVLVIRDITDVPDSARAEKRVIEDTAIRSIISVPLMLENDRMLGILDVNMEEDTRQWAEKDIAMLCEAGSLLGRYLLIGDRAERLMQSCQASG